MTDKSNTETIKLEDGSEDEWVCVCGNHSCRTGFLECDETGQYVEATEEAWKTGWYICAECGRMFDGETLEVVAHREIKSPPGYDPDYDINKENPKPCAVCGEIIDYHISAFRSYNQMHENKWVCSHHTLKETESALGRKLDFVERAEVNGEQKLYLGRWIRKPVMKPD